MSLQSLLKNENLDGLSRKPIVFFTLNVNELDDGEKASPIMKEWEIKSFTRALFEF